MTARLNSVKYECEASGLTMVEYRDAQRRAVLEANKRHLTRKLDFLLEVESGMGHFKPYDIIFRVLYRYNVAVGQS